MAVILNSYTGRECADYLTVRAPAAKQQVRQVVGNSIRRQGCGELHGSQPHRFAAAHCTAAPTKCRKMCLRLRWSWVTIRNGFALAPGSLPEEGQLSSGDC